MVKKKNVNSYGSRKINKKRHRPVGLNEIKMPYFLISIRNGEQHATVPRGGFSYDSDGEVIVERVGDERLCEAADVGVRSEAVGGVALETRDEGDGWREGNADQLREVQGSLSTMLWKTQAGEVGATLEEGGKK